MSTFTTADGVGLAYRTNGEGRPLVMLPGWGQTQAMFTHQLDGLAEGRQVVTYDHRGHGMSEKPQHGYRIARLAQDLHELLDHLGADQVDLLGWSMGASVLWSYLDQRGTGRVRRAVFVDQPAAVASVPWMDPDVQKQCGAIFGVGGLLELCAAIDGPDGAAATESFVRGMFSGEPDPDLWDFVRKEVRALPAYAAVPLLFDHCAQDWRDVLPRVDVPTLVIGCDGSHVHPDSQRYIGEHIPDATVHIFGDDVAQSHFPFLQSPAVFNSLIGDFLS